MKVCIFTNARDEKHIKEWISHHLNIGFDHVYVFDHKSIIPIKEQIQPNKSITIMRIDYDKDHLKEHLMMKARDIAKASDIEWMLYLDADEFFIMKDYNDVHKFIEKYSYYNQVGFNWLVFGTNYLSHEPEGMLFENYTRCTSSFDIRIKCFVRPNQIITTLSPHVFKISDMKLSINGITHKPLHTNNPSHYAVKTPYIEAPAYIAHYMYQSYSVYLSRKVNMPRDDTNAFRPKLSEGELNNNGSNDIINIDLRDRFSEKNKKTMAEL